MKILKNILILAVMAMGLSLAASAQTQAGNNGCGTWGFYGSQHTLTNCFNEAENVLILETDGQVGHFTLGPGQTAYFGKTVFGTPNDEAYCAVIN